MKRFLTLCMVMLMICSMAACSKPAEPSGPQVIPYEDLDEYTLTFTNDGMKLVISHELMNKALNNQHKNTDLMREALENNDTYFAETLETQVIVYNYDDVQATGIQMRIPYQTNLLTDGDIEIHTIPTVSYIGDKYPMERLYQIEKLGFEHYGIMINVVYKIGHSGRSLEFKASLQGRVVFENKTEPEKLPTAKLNLTESGATLTLKKDDILAEVADKLTAGEIQSLGMIMYTSKHEYEAGSMYIAKANFDEESDTITLVFEYERAEGIHQALLDEHQQVQRELYAELPLLITSGESEYAWTFYIRCEL